MDLVQWTSRKFTPTKMLYVISENEMYAIFWMVKKFEYKLGGKKFKIETDHKVLVKFRNKPGFENNRDNRWIEKMQSLISLLNKENRKG